MWTLTFCTFSCVASSFSRRALPFLPTFSSWLKVFRGLKSDCRTQGGGTRVMGCLEWCFVQRKVRSLCMKIPGQVLLLVSLQNWLIEKEEDPRESTYKNIFQPLSPILSFPIKKNVHAPVHKYLSRKNHDY